MLTADLIQARIYRGEVRPRYLDPGDREHLALAQRLIGIFESAIGAPRRALDEELAALLGAGTGFLLHRALAKLLRDRCTFDTESPVEPLELRSRVFESAARAYRETVALGPGGGGSEAVGERAPFRFDRERVLGKVAAEFDLGPAELEACLYADLKEEQRLLGFDRCEPAWLLKRYNVALAQGVLFRATGMTLDLVGQTPRRARELFRKIKFFQLLHSVARRGKGTWRIHLDGPFSLFKASQRYGLQMASFLPTLLHFEGWKLQAEVLWGRERKERTFKLAAKDGLKPYGRYLAGQWQPEEVAWLPERIEALGGDWEASTETEVIDLGGQGILIPDFLFTHRPSGFTATMEVLGYWRRGAVKARLELIRQQGPKRFVLALSQALAAGEEGLDELPVEVYLFRSAPVARKVVEVLERLRTRE